MAGNKTVRNNADVGTFLNSLNNKQQRLDAQKICQLMQEVSGEEPKMWGSSIVGFGSVRLQYASGRELDWMLVGFSPRKNNLTLYIMTGFDEYAQQGGYNPKPILEKLGKYTTGKSCLYIKRLSDVDQEVLKKLIAGSVEQMKKVYQS